MILGNFLGIDPTHRTPGLSRNNNLHEEIWQDFAANPIALREVADAIGRACESNGEISLSDLVPEEVFPESELLTRLHLVRERNRTLVERKREQVLATTGQLACEACDFDFTRVYGTLGDGFAECHHLVPLSQLPAIRSSRLADLAIVCANCHRMLHRARPTIAIANLRALLLKYSSTNCPS